MTGCDDFEIAVEQRLHGALGPAEAATLEAHLSTCERCRAFEATARGTEAVMREAAEAAMARVDWAAVERAVARWRRRNRLLVGLVLAVALLLLAQLLLQAGSGRRAGGAPVTVASALAVLVVAAAVRWRQARRMALAGRSAETIGLLRRDLAGRTRLVRVLLVGCPAYAAACAVAAWRLAEGPDQRLLFSTLAVAGLALWPFIWFVKRPILARERAELDGAAGR